MTAPAPDTPTPAATRAPAETTPATLATTTAEVGVPTPGPADPEPFFDGGDWVTLAVGIVAAFIAVLAWRASLRAAQAAEDAVVEQRAANKIESDRDEREAAAKAKAFEEAASAERDRLAADEQEAKRQASLVAVHYSYNGGSIDVGIVNNSKQTFRDLLLVDVVCVAHPDSTWERNRKIFGGPQVRSPQLWGLTSHTVPVVFKDQDGKQQYELGDCFGALVRFTDEEDRRWEIGDDAGPHRVPLDDGDLARSGSG